MPRDAARIDLSTRPDLVELVQELKRTRRPQLIQEEGETVALLVPATQPRRSRTPRRRLVDTSALSPVRYRSIAELVRHQPVPPARSFTDAELKEAIDEARAEAWRAKHQ
jgi:antitoxin (DNA-binding transcriptional repressor) of toxin-antitoxin stability system